MNVGLHKFFGRIFHRPGFQAACATMLLMCVAFPGVALAQNDTLHMTDQAFDGKFTGVAFVTKNLAWQDMWQRPEPPEFEAFDRLLLGERAALALVFSNAAIREGHALIHCEITAYETDGSIKTVFSDICFDGPYVGKRVLFPTQLSLEFAPSPEDPSGLAHMQVTMRDEFAGREVDLHVSVFMGASK